MRLLLLASAAALIGGPAFAQSMLGQSQPTPVVVPPAPPVVAAPVTLPPAPAPVAPAPPPGLVQTPVPPPDTDSGSANTDNGDNSSGQATQMQAVSPSAPAAAPTQPPPPDVAPTPSNDWVQGQTATLGVLNKVDGSSSQLTVPVGGQATAGDLIVSVQACVTRPPGALPDSAVFLTLQPKDAQGGSPVYRGWMLRSAPGAADAGNAGQAFRVIACS